MTQTLLEKIAAEEYNPETFESIEEEAKDDSLRYISNPCFKSRKFIKSIDDNDLPPSYGKKVVLTREQERLAFYAFNYCKFKSIKSRDGESRRQWISKSIHFKNILVWHNSPLVIYNLRPYLRFECDIDELYAEGLYALNNVIDRFDPSMGNKFSTYATVSIVRAIHRMLKLENKHRSFEFDDKLYNESSYDNINEYMVDLYDVLNTLSDKEKKVLMHRFGLNGHKRLTLTETGKLFGLTRERIRQIQDIALNKLRYKYDGTTNSKTKRKYNKSSNATELESAESAETAETADN